MFEGVPTTVQFDNARPALVELSKVKLVVCVLVKENCRTPLDKSFNPTKVGRVMVAFLDWLTAMVFPSRDMLAVRLDPLLFAEKLKLTTPLVMPPMVNQE